MAGMMSLQGIMHVRIMVGHQLQSMNCIMAIDSEGDSTELPESQSSTEMDDHRKVIILLASYHALTDAYGQAWKDKLDVTVQDPPLHKPGGDVLAQAHAEHVQSKIADGVHLLEEAAHAAAAAQLPVSDTDVEKSAASVDGFRAARGLACNR